MSEDVSAAPIEKGSRYILKAERLSDLPSLIEKGGARAAYIELPPHPHVEELLKASAEIAPTQYHYSGRHTHTEVRTRFARLGLEAPVLDYVMAEYELLEDTFRDYDIVTVFLAGARSVNQGDDLVLHPDVVEPEMAVGVRRVIATMAGPATFYADDLAGTNLIQPNGRAVTVHRMSGGALGPYGAGIDEKLRLGAYHKRPTDNAPRFTMVLDLIKKAPASNTQEFKP